MVLEAKNKVMGMEWDGMECRRGCGYMLERNEQQISW